jgi:hypothetical protein
LFYWPPEYSLQLFVSPMGQFSGQANTGSDSGAQAGDLETPTSRQEQQSAVVEATIDLLDNVAIAD